MFFSFSMKHVTGMWECFLTVQKEILMNRAIKLVISSFRGQSIPPNSKFKLSIQSSLSLISVVSSRRICLDMNYLLNIKNVSFLNHKLEPLYDELK